MIATGLWRFWMDTGGTFTDCLAQDPAGGWHRLKVLSSGALRVRVAAAPRDREVVLAGLPAVATPIWAGFRLTRAGASSGSIIRSWNDDTQCAALEDALGLRPDDLIDLTTGEEAPVVAMRVLTGTPPGATLPPAELRLATTRGTNALLERRGARVAFFITAGFGDILRIRDQRRPDLFAIKVEKPPPLHGPVVEVEGRFTADGAECVALDLTAVRRDAERLRAEGIDVAAVALLHSFRYPQHEFAVAQVLREAGFRFVSLSSELAPLIKLVPRAETAVVDALLAPVMESYLSGVAAAVDPARFQVMTSAGGLVRRASFRSKDSLLSGPAGGVAGAAAVARRAGIDRIITFDMGGTSTDVARFEGDFDYQFQHAVGPARVFAPALRVESVAAGGGSICRFDGTVLVVGPESAGAKPGPACYGAGGPLTLTDVNLLLGRLDPANFGLPVFPEAAEKRLAEVMEAVAAGRGRAPSREEMLRGFLEIADERMAEAIRRISVREGYDPGRFALVAFGGAGGLHACAVAERLGIRHILHPADSGLLSAFGLGQAAEERIVERQILRPWSGLGGEVSALVREVEAQAREDLAATGVDAASIRVRRADLEMRFSGQDAGLVVEAHPLDDVEARFAATYRGRFGYVPRDRAVELVSIRAVASSAPAEPGLETFPRIPPTGAWTEGGILARAELRPNGGVVGECIVQDRFSTLHVGAGWTGVCGSSGSVLLERAGSVLSGAGAPAGRDDVVALELFTNRFRALVDDMGLLLQRCALSVNVKERLDFSCALLDAGGELVTNAPHVPVHLGALGLCVRRVCEVLDLKAGDVALTNHPAFGGAHLPDVTLIAPVHAANGGLVGFVANRAHHAEIGGARPGSMPPDARRLAEEGVVLAPRILVRDGEADWDGLRLQLQSAAYPSRRVDENIADLHAQLASIQLGVGALQRLAAEHTADEVSRQMELLKARAADALAEALASRATDHVRAGDLLDDGTPVVVNIRREGTRLVVDFAGSGGVHPGNLNATPAIVRSALIYVLRLLVGRELPLNEGLMRDVDLRVPEGLLSPNFTDDPAHSPAVVGGNVETSQRVVDVLIRAFGLAASSQGTMNNVIFGNERFSYYETIAGGTGAGYGFAGCDAVHSHMTNTAITDPEVLETRLPVRLWRFALRAGSGGAGRFRGGDGIVRELEFLERMELSVLTQRRTVAPSGAEGGEAGRPGEQWIDSPRGNRRELGPIAGVVVERGDRLIISTPGGGGWGANSPEISL